MDSSREQQHRMWTRFMDTGEIGAYLMYRALRAAQEAPPSEK